MKAYKEEEINLDFHAIKIKLSRDLELKVKVQKIMESV